MATPEVAQTIRRFVLTGSIAAITATGAWYGAGLKTQQEFKKETEARREATPTERIEQLEIIRTDLLRKRMGIQRKLDELNARPKKTQDQP